MDQPITPQPVALAGIAINLSADGRAIVLQIKFQPKDATEPAGLDIPLDHDAAAMLGGQFLACAGAVKAKLAASPLVAVHGLLGGANGKSG